MLSLVGTQQSFELVHFLNMYRYVIDLSRDEWWSSGGVMEDIIKVNLSQFVATNLRGMWSIASRESAREIETS